MLLLIIENGMEQDTRKKKLDEDTCTDCAIILELIIIIFNNSFTLKKWSGHGLTSRTTSYGPAIEVCPCYLYALKKTKCLVET